MQAVENAQYEVKKEALWAAVNATSGGNANQMKYLIEGGFMKALVCAFRAFKSDARLLMTGLEGLKNILTANPDYARDFAKSEGALDILDEFQAHENEEVYTKTVDLLKQYFSE